MARTPSDYLQLLHGRSLPRMTRHGATLTPDQSASSPMPQVTPSVLRHQVEDTQQQLQYLVDETQSSPYQVATPYGAQTVESARSDEDDESYESEDLHGEYEIGETSEIPDEELTAEEEAGMDVDSVVPFDVTGWKEIGNLASWTVSSFKPGCGIDALRDDDVSMFWQSDGPQPHHLNIHFSRLVSIHAIRLYLDFEVDESYTPTRILLQAGTGYHDLIPFSNLTFTQPKGWQDVDLSNVGGGKGDELRCFLVQIKIVENHQNGKDTHLRGLKLYAKDERTGRMIDKKVTIRDEGEKPSDAGKGKEEARKEKDVDIIVEPSWMTEFELR